MTEGIVYVSVDDAALQLDELCRRAIAGDIIVLTMDGRPSVRLVPVSTEKDSEPVSADR